MCMISHVTITSNNHGIIYVHVCEHATTSVQCTGVHVYVQTVYGITCYHYK